jgi:ribosomal 50S subunit-associated protein YjgA (DUF615 family)
MQTHRRQLRFHLPVVVQPRRIDRDRVVTTPAEAAEMLLRQWPDGEFSKRVKAMQACLKVIRGEKPPHIARTAFIAAAKEARIFIAEGVSER